MKPLPCLPNGLQEMIYVMHQLKTNCKRTCSLLIHTYPLLSSLWIQVRSSLYCQDRHVGGGTDCPHLLYEAPGQPLLKPAAFRKAARHGEGSTIFQPCCRLPLPFILFHKARLKTCNQRGRRIASCLTTEIVRNIPAAARKIFLPAAFNEASSKPTTQQGPWRQR